MAQSFQLGLFALKREFNLVETASFQFQQCPLRIWCFFRRDEILDEFIGFEFVTVVRKRPSRFIYSTCLTADIFVPFGFLSDLSRNGTLP